MRSCIKGIVQLLASFLRAAAVLELITSRPRKACIYSEVQTLVDPAYSPAL